MSGCSRAGAAKPCGFHVTFELPRGRSSYPQEGKPVDRGTVSAPIPARGPGNLKPLEEAFPEVEDLPPDDVAQPEAPAPLQRPTSRRILPSLAVASRRLGPGRPQQIHQLQSSRDGRLFRGAAEIGRRSPSNIDIDLRGVAVGLSYDHREVLAWMQAPDVGRPAARQPGYVSTMIRHRGPAGAATEGGVIGPGFKLMDMFQVMTYWLLQDKYPFI